MASDGPLKHLADAGFKVDDLVLYSNDDEAPGGIIYQIVQNVEPMPATVEWRRVIVKKKFYNAKTNAYDDHCIEEVRRGAWDAAGKKIMINAVTGFIRIRPVFEFFATPRGKKPRGKDHTLIVQYNEIKRYNLIKHVDLTLLGTKYVELGNIIRDIARRGGMKDPSDVHVSEG